VCLDLLTYTREEIYVCIDIKRKEMSLYLKKGEHMCRCLLAKECVAKYLCVCYKDV